MHDAGNPAAMLGLHEEHVAAVPFRDDLVLQILRGVLAAQVRLERASQARALLAQPLPNELQLGARMVDDITRRVDLVARLRRLAFERLGAAARGFEQRKRSRRASDSSPRFVDRIEKRSEREQAERFERAPFNGQCGQNLRQIGGCAQRERPVGDDVPRRLARSRLKLGDLVGVGRRPQVPEALGPHGRESKVFDGVDDPIEFEGAQGAWLHRGNR